MYAELARQQAVDEHDPTLESDTLMQFSSERAMDQFKEMANVWVGLLDIVQAQNRKVGDYYLAKESDEDDVRVNEAYAKILEKMRTSTFRLWLDKKKLRKINVILDSCKKLRMSKS